MTPVAAITGRLAWGADGSCWAFSRLDGFPYQPGVQQAALDALHAAVARLHGEYAMWGLCEPIPAREIDHAAQTGLGYLPQAMPWKERFRRGYYLAVRVLPPARRARPWAIDPRAAVPPQRTIDAAEQAATLADRRAGRLPGRPATPAEIAWIIERVMHRGSVDLPVGQTGTVLAGETLAELADCWVTNGGPPADDLAVRVASTLNQPADPQVLLERIRRELDAGPPPGPRLARWARVVGPYGQGFQATLAVEQVPQQVLLPGGTGEWLARVHQLPYCVDWHIRGRTGPAHTAVQKIRQKLRNLAGSADDLAGDAAQPPPSLADAFDDLKHQEAELARTGQPELVWSCTLTVASTDPDELEARVAGIEELFAGQDYLLPRRLGRQRALLVAQLPCAPYGRRAALWAYRQFTQPAGMVAAAPFCGAAQADPAGLLLAEDASSGLRTPLYWQPGYAASINRSPSIILGGELGSGKSKAAKRIVIEGLLSAGGRFVGIDATRSQEMPDGTLDGEWTHLARLYQGEVVDVVDGQVSIDPLAMGLPVATARRLLSESLAVACGYDDATREADLLARAVADVAAAGGRAADVADQLAAGGDPVALEVVDRLATVADYLPALFDRARRAPDLDARFLVFAAYGLEMPSYAELANPELARKITKGKRCAQAVVFLAAALAKHIGWTTPGSCLIGLDEAWRITTNPFGADVVNEITKEGRRYDCGLLIAVQNVGSLPEDVLSFAGQVLAFRCHGPAAQALAQLVGVATEDIEALAAITNPDGEPAPGFCWWRTVRGDLNLALIIRPPDPGLDAATETTPTRRAA